MRREEIMIFQLNTKLIIYKSFIVTFLILSLTPAAYAEIIPVYPDTDLTEINQFINSAAPGDTIFFQAGIYKGPFTLNNLNGKLNKPIVIIGESNEYAKLVTIDGEAEPGMNQENFAFYLKESSWINIENFIIKNCWTYLIRADDVSYLSVKNCDMTGGKRAVFATGRGSHHFLVENCNWQQDERVWTHEDDYSWEEIYHGIHQHYNGSIFQGSRISGVFVIRDNYIQNTFNAL